MSHIHRGGLVVSAALFVMACGGGTQSTSAPTLAASTAGATSAPATPGATEAPTSSLDPSQSDAGIAARVTISNDTRGQRDGTHDIYGLADDGSECSGAFEDEYLVVAWFDDAPDGQIRRFSIGVAHDDVPSSDGSTTDITNGGVSFSFSGGFIGTTYTGNATEENEGSSTIDVTRSGPSLTFDFEGVTNDGVGFFGQLICAEV